MKIFIITLFLPAIAYLLGSVPFGLLIVRQVAGIDIRQVGSGNIGATNVRRAAGSKWAAATLTCDILKGLLPTTAALVLGATACHWLAAITALAAVCGHMYPIFFKFKPSGKGVATTLGTMLTAAPWACLIAVTAFLIAVRLSHRVSVGSLTGIFLLPPSTWFTSHDPALTMATFIIMILILARHKENIERLARGNEPVIGKR